MSSRRTLTRADPNSRQAPKSPRVPICKRRGQDATNLHLSTKKIRKTQFKQSIPQVQNPPQAEILAQEYIHNLQQQLYFLESELRFLHDRSGVDDNPENTSVDSAIRRLRRAIAMHEEETNKKIAGLEQMIDERKNEIEQIDESKATENLDMADARERDGIEKLKSAFIETASKIHMHQLEKNHFDNVADFQNALRDTIAKDVNDKQARKDAAKDDLKKLEASLDDIRQKRKELIQKFNDSIRNKRMHEEEADLLEIIGSEEEQPPPNLPISSLNANNSKVENDIQIAKTTKKEIEQQIDRLLEEGVKLKAEINEMNAKVDRARKLKDKMDRQFQTKFANTNDTNAKLKNEIDSIKKARKDAKNEFEKCNAQFDDYLKQVNQLQTEQQLLSEVIKFKENEKKRIDNENEKTKDSIEGLKAEIGMLHDELRDLSEEIAKAAEKQRRVEALVEMNNMDPRCQMKNLPPELAQLLENLNAVNEQLD